MHDTHMGSMCAEHTPSHNTAVYTDQHASIVYSQPVLTPPTLRTLGNMMLGEKHVSEMRVGYIIMISCLMIIALGVIFTFMDRLQEILIPFVLAVALSYLLTPLVNFLSCHGQAHRCRLHRGIAVGLAFLVGVGVLVFVALVLLRALTIFQERSASYADRVEDLLESMFETAERWGLRIASNETALQRHADHTAAQEAQELVKGFLSEVSVTNIILELLGTAAHVAEAVMYIVLFLIFMLAHTSERDPRNHVGYRCERKIYTYIRGKSAISGFVGGMHAFVLWLVGLQVHARTTPRTPSRYGSTMTDSPRRSRRSRTDLGGRGYGSPLECSPSFSTSSRMWVAWAPCFCPCRSSPSILSSARRRPPSPSSSRLASTSSQRTSWSQRSSAMQPT